LLRRFVLLQLYWEVNDARLTRWDTQKTRKFRKFAAECREIYAKRTIF
jgi:hypothetical protein